MIQDDMILHRVERPQRRKATDLNDEEFLRHIKLGGGMFLDGDAEESHPQGTPSLIEEVRVEFNNRIRQLAISIDTRFKTIERQIAALQQTRPTPAPKSLHQFRGVDLAST